MHNLKLLIYLLLITTFFTSFSQNNKIESEVFEKQDSVYVVDLKAVDYAFSMPGEIPSGWITFRMENMGKQNHVAMIYRSKTDLSREELRKKLDSVNFDFIETTVGGPGFHTPGNKSDIAVHLDPGNYVMICGLQAENGKSHYELGMQMPFKVTKNPSGAAKPEADTKITLEKYKSSRTKAFATGEQTVEIVHEGYPMDFHLLRVKDSTTIKKALSYMNGLKDPSPVEWLTGVEQADPGRSTFVTYNFTPGEYAWISHEYGMWGMMERFQIRKGDKNKELPPVKQAPPEKEIKITFGREGLDYPEEIPTGNSRLIIENKQTDEYVFHYFLLKEGKTKEDLIHNYNQFLQGKFDEAESAIPWASTVELGPLGSMEETHVDFKVEARNYILMGPIDLKQSFKEQWSHEIIHGMKGVE